MALPTIKRLTFVEFQEMGLDGRYELVDGELERLAPPRPLHSWAVGRILIELWPVPLTVGQPLPVLPLALLNADVVPVDFEATYQEACRRGRLESRVGSPAEAPH